MKVIVYCRWFMVLVEVQFIKRHQRENSACRGPRSPDVRWPRNFGRERSGVTVELAVVLLIATSVVMIAMTWRQFKPPKLSWETSDFIKFGATLKGNRRIRVVASVTCPHQVYRHASRNDSV